MMVLGQSHIYTYDDGTAYGFTVPKDNFDEALWRLADFMMDLIPDTAGITKERTIVPEEMGAWNRKIFDLFYAKRIKIESDFGGELEWKTVEGQRACSVWWIHRGSGLLHEKKWEGIHEKMIDALIRFVDAFKYHIEKL